MPTGPGQNACVLLFVFWWISVYNWRSLHQVLNITPSFTSQPGACYAENLVVPSYNIQDFSPQRATVGAIVVVLMTPGTA